MTGNKHKQKNTHPGLVITQHGATAIIEDNNGRLFHCKIRRNLGRLVCGDRVLIQTEDKSNGVVIALNPRSSILERPLSNGQSRLVAANIDQIVIVMAVQPAFSEALVDRYLVIAELTGIQPVIVLNKTDLLDEHTRPLIQAQLSCYTDLGYTVIETSVKQEHGLDALENQLQTHTSILVGQSGVGKSSLVKALLPDIDIRIGALTDAMHGRHTTSTSILYHLPGSGDLIDSPGVRDFGIWHLEAEQLVSGYREFADWSGQCRFSNCSHTHEPDCAVSRAAESGKINPARYRRYQDMYAELTSNG